MSPNTSVRLLKRYRKWAFFLGLLLFLSYGFTTSLSPTQTRTVRVGVYQNEPKIFIDVNGHASGFFIELLDKIADGGLDTGLCAVRMDRLPASAPGWRNRPDAGCGLFDGTGSNI